MQRVVKRQWGILLSVSLIASPHLVVFNDQGELDHVNTVTNGNLLGGTPDQAILFQSTHFLFHLIEISLIVPRLDTQGNDRLCDSLSLDGFLFSSLLVVVSYSLSFDSFCFCVFLIIRSKQVDVVIIFVFALGGCSGSSRCRSGSRSGKRKEYGSVDLLHTVLIRTYLSSTHAKSEAAFDLSPVR
jgi:hypothetical protein